MSYYNQIVFLSSFAIVGVACAMDVPAENMFITLHNNTVEYHTGGNICYYDEYHAMPVGHKIVSFPIKCTDPLPIERCGDKSFFVTSAKEGKFGRSGEALMIFDPAIKKLAVVRGKSQDNNHIAVVYIGFDTDAFEEIDYKGSPCRTYRGRIMTMEIRQEAGKDKFYESRPVYDEVALFTFNQIKQEVDKLLEGYGVKNRKKARQEFQDQATKLLEGRASDFDFKEQRFNFKKCYWTSEGNGLKNITYRSATK